MRKKMYESLVKRIFDIFLSCILLVIFFLPMLAVLFIIRITLGKPVFFVQKRPGLNGKKFAMIKFRTMKNLKDESGRLLSDEQRMTKLGSLLRKTSIDELPELINILKGDMSFIGPRPQLIEDELFMDENIKKRHMVRPGLTGLAQINGRNNISWDEKFKYDLKYIENLSFRNDFSILVKTVYHVFKTTGISSEGFATGENYGDYLLRTNKITREMYESIKNGV